MKKIILVGNCINFLFLFGTLGSFEIDIIGFKEALLKISISIIFGIVLHLLSKLIDNYLINKKIR